jgi:hypothetical protein
MASLLTATALLAAAPASVWANGDDKTLNERISNERLLSLGRIGGDSSDVKAGTLNGLFDFSDKNRAPKLILDDSTGTILQQN